ncbi:RecB family exonuclease [Congzhengia minquanensis]|uniref:PD-(D/E)XK nuclease family protein n=1 Tax=Congzhengia minquanensis TaxID=2763657 RepID=A0A926HZ42_9FIRM|nr:PD-(D/E)XK nuclease family protein [Congzhengia minquanensis]MBC8540770.1 PD-(D/E)XK nuclease family protein [Congzhengia minquanensis]
MNKDSFIIDSMVWSFSRLSSYHQCPYGWRLKYVDCVEGDENFFAQYGSLMHEILEKYEKEELSIFEISQYYENRFNDVVTCDAPPNPYIDIKQSYYDKGLDYLDNIDLDLENYEVLGVEKEVTFKIFDYEMVGYIDLLLKDKIKGDIIVLDHKSGSVNFKKNGEISSSEKEHILGFKRQLYLYSIGVIEEYGVKPKYLKWNLFKDRNWLTFEFKDEEFKEAKKWAEDTIKSIEQETSWFPNPQKYFCNNLCDMRNCACEYKP